MKAHLMFRDRDFDVDAPPPANVDDLMLDLGLDALFDAMADGDWLLRAVAERAVLIGLRDAGEVAYRQECLRDCLEHPEVVRELYGLTLEILQRDREVFRTSADRNVDAILHASRRRLELYLPLLERLRRLSADARDGFRSEGFRTLFAMLVSELDDAYLGEVQEHLRRLRFPGGILVSVDLGDGAKGRDYTLRKGEHHGPGWMQRMSAHGGRSYTYRLAPRDEAGGRAFAELRMYGTAAVARSLSIAADHILGFFNMLRVELAFYVGSLNAHERLTAIGTAMCIPEACPPGGGELSFAGLTDVCSTLSSGQRMVGNALEADGASLVMVTGANQGGKSTFLRSIGSAHLMMACGMFVPAASFRAALAGGVLTHYRREEDAGMNSGKLDEELARMSTLVDQLRPDALVLFNESFAATNEREGAEIARQIIRGLREHGFRVCFVTHQYELAGSLCREGGPAVFLRAERRPDGTRTFRIVPGEPLRTSFGDDLYERILGPDLREVAAAGERAPAG